MVDQLFIFTNAVKREPAIEAWLQQQPAELAALARYWFDVLRNCGDDVHEVMHDGHPTACVEQAAFAEVNAFTAHVNVGFFRGAQISDPDGLLQGTGKYMRHVKLSPAAQVDSAALTRLITTAYNDMRARLSSQT